MALSGGQQQRLCIARAIATKPDVILMDEPCSALDPIATSKIEDLMRELVSDYTIVIVTHNMQQAARVSDRTAFFTVEVADEGHGRAWSSSSTTPRRSSRIPSDPADRGLRHGAVRMTRESVPRGAAADRARAAHAGRARRRPRPAIRRGAGGARRRHSRRRSSTDDDAIDELYLQIDSGTSVAARAAVAGRGGPPADLARSCTAACTWSGSATRRSTSRSSTS